MGLTIYKARFSELTQEPTARLDASYHAQVRGGNDNTIRFCDLFDFVAHNRDETKALVEKLSAGGEFQYAEIGDVTGLGDVHPVKLDFSKRNLLTEAYYRKIENGNVFQAIAGDVLIAKIRPALKKIIYVDTARSCYFTTAFVHLRPRGDNRTLYFLLRTLLFDQLVALARRGKGYPTISEGDLARMRIPSHLIRAVNTNRKLVDKLIHDYDKELARLLPRRKTDQAVIDQYFADRLGLSGQLRSTSGGNKKVGLKDLLIQNPKARLSARWSNVHLLQSEFRESGILFEKLGAYILQTRNGWSPVCGETGKHAVLGVEAIRPSTQLCTAFCKWTDQTRDDLSKYLVTKGDFFVSRGNTVNLVALASVARTGSDFANTIFPDLFIRVKFDEDQVDINYIAYIFNSFVGRYYFGNASKGKNQTMVKVSSQEIRDFYVPMPSRPTQNTISRRISKRIGFQRLISKMITERTATLESDLREALERA